jgi:hypothetical protein
MSFDLNQVKVYNVYGQKVLIKVFPKPGCYGPLDILDDEVGIYVLTHEFNQAIKLHYSQYAIRYVDKRNALLQWLAIHSDGKCEVCRRKLETFNCLNSEPDFDLKYLFGESNSDALAVRPKLPAPPLPPIRSSSASNLSSDVEVIFELRRKLKEVQLKCDRKIKILTDENTALKELIDAVFDNILNDSDEM